MSGTLVAHTGEEGLWASALVECAYKGAIWGRLSDFTLLVALFLTFHGFSGPEPATTLTEIPTPIGSFVRRRLFPEHMDHRAPAERAGHRDSLNENHAMNAW